MRTGMAKHTIVVVNRALRVARFGGAGNAQRTTFNAERARLQVRAAVMGGLAGGFFAAAAPAQDTLGDWIGGAVDAVVAEASQWEFDPGAVPEVFDAAELNRVLGVLQNALASGSVDTLAPLKPYAEEALRTVEAFPELAAYAGWLRQRLDYFEVADEVVRSRPPPPKPPPPPPPSPAPAPTPSPKPPTPPPPQSSVTESDYDVWYGKIRKRTAPARASELVPALKPVFREEGVPEEIVWLAEVESSFNPSAQSPVGARGLYQFMPATAERFGLALKPKDERLDPAKSARAAAQYLRFLHRKFGDWQLALAAYNAGEGRVGRLLAKTQGTGFEDIAVHLPAETRMYVPKMRAVVQVREGVDLRTL